MKVNTKMLVSLFEKGFAKNSFSSEKMNSDINQIGLP